MKLFRRKVEPDRAHTGPASEAASLIAPHAEPSEQALIRLKSSPKGLSQGEAETRLQNYGSNVLPEARPPGILNVFLHQFASPLIYVLVAAAAVSMLIKDWSDAAFIGAVLLINAIIGTAQEYSAHRAAAALRKLVSTSSRVLRDGDSYEIDAGQLVPGDVILLESGDRIPADIRLLNSHDLEVDESLLTGESLAVLKDSAQILEADSVLGDRTNMVFAGTMVNRGRGRGLVVGTALKTELGQIASAVLGKTAAKAPLLARMETFTHRVAAAVGIAALVMAGVALSRGMPLNEIFLLAVALAVSAIPEGLPVALTVALAISMRRMARRNVIVRKLLAVESLGSCTIIATDKTGTLTVNQLTTRRIVLPGCDEWEVTGDSLIPEGAIVTPGGSPGPEETRLLKSLFEAAVLANEGYLAHRGGGWTHQGDAVDVALLVAAHKMGVIQEAAREAQPELATIEFESERLFAASLNGDQARQKVSVKGALERLVPMCNTMATAVGNVTIDPKLLERQANDLAKQGFRVIALCSGIIEPCSREGFSEERLQGLTLLGLVGMIDPLRAEAKVAIAECRDAGIKVVMLTGDHPTTAYAIARELSLVESQDQVVTGIKLKQAENDAAFDQLTRGASVFARVEPQQKHAIVQSLQRCGHFVAVSGDGANDAPALKSAEVGVAMGKSGTDIARETAEIMLTDDNFTSIVAGVEEGRIAYANVRKVIFLLISTGAAELVLFTLALITALPLPLMAIQLLWLNLVTNGIQDVALAFEPGEGKELQRPPRPPEEGVFNRLMVERVVISAMVIGTVAFFLFQELLERGFTVDEARNGTLMLMVLFENIHVFNSRSETLSAFRHNPLRNPLLLFGTLMAQLIHIGAMYTPWLSEVLRVEPISPRHWLELLGLAFSVLVVMELHKLVWKAMERRRSS